jgi:hypothetical protein
VSASPGGGETDAEAAWSSLPEAARRGLLEKRERDNQFRIYLTALIAEARGQST